MTTPGSGTTGTAVCFVAEHEYSGDIRGDHMIRVVSPSGVFAEAVGTPGAQLEIRAPQDKKTTNKGGNSGESVSEPQSAQGGADSGATSQRPSDDRAGQSDGDENPEGQQPSSDGQDRPAREPLKIRPKDRVGLRAVVVFPGSDADDDRDVTNAVEWKTSKPEVATINTMTGVARGELTARAEGTTAVTARYSGMVAKRKVVVVGKLAKALRIESANGETSVRKGQTLPLRATVTYDSGKSEQVTEDITWSSSDENVADVDSGGEVEGVAAGSSTITGKYSSKDGTELSSELDVEVTGGTGDDQDNQTDTPDSGDSGDSSESAS